MPRRIPLPLTLALACGLIACAGETTDEELATDTMAADTMAAPMQPSQPPAGALTEPQILQVVMTVNTADSAGGELAQRQGTAEAVKAFGQRMIQDHGQANQQLRQLAQQASLTPQESEVSAQLQTEHQQTSQTLQGLSGAEFDRRYIEHEVQLHEQALQLLEQQLGNVQNAQLRQQLESLRTSVQSHLEQARQVQGQLQQGGQTTTAD